MLLTGLVFLAASVAHAYGQGGKPGKVYIDMSRAERLEFIREQARRIAREMSGNEYEFTNAFEGDIQKAVTRYAERIGDRTGRTDLRVVFERAQTQASLVNAAFRARNLSPIFGLYLAWIESEYNNQAASPTGALGVFQILPSTGERYGLSTNDLLDVGKSADAAARYIVDSLESFKDDPMKEALAVHAYNQGGQKVSRDLKVVLDNQNKRCSICALTADRSKRDEAYKPEGVFYVPRFFAAAIVGENPQAFGLKMQPLSSH
jgi:soluble lytic murein transglycosylase-like protein